MSFVSPKKVFEQGWISVPQGGKVFEPENQIQQAGIDLRVQDIYRLAPHGDAALPEYAQIPNDTAIAFIGQTEKELPTYQKLSIDSDHYGVERNERRCYWIPPGAYTIDFVEHVQIPEDCFALIMHRSTLNRSGTILTGSIFDPGFSGQVGCTMYVHQTIVIEPLARLAQIVFITGEAASLYEGDYNDKDHAALSSAQLRKED